MPWWWIRSESDWELFRDFYPPQALPLQYDYAAQHLEAARWQGVDPRRATAYLRGLGSLGRDVLLADYRAAVKEWLRTVERRLGFS
jgi:hypothetical protein